MVYRLASDHHCASRVHIESGIVVVGRSPVTVLVMTMVVVAVMASGWRRRTFNNGSVPLSRLPFTLPSCSTDAASRIVVKHPRLLIASNRTSRAIFQREIR